MKLVIFLTLTIVGVFAQESGSAKDIIAKTQNCVLEKKHSADKCIADFFTDIRPMLAVGIPELDVPPLNPIHIDTVSFPDDSVLLQGKGILYNMTVNGIGNYTVKKVSVDYDKNTITLELPIEKIYIEGLYEVDGNFLILPVKGKGEMSINFTTVDTVLIGKLERSAKGVVLAALDADFQAKDIDVFMANLLGDQEVSLAINNLINDNAQEVTKELKPSLKVKLGEALKNVIVNILKEVPESVLIKPSS